MKLGLSDIIALGLTALGILGYFVEISKIKINPLSALAKIFNAELFKRMDSLEAKVTNVDVQLGELQEKQVESEIKAARMRIQRFADEMYGEVRHSKEHFDLILMDITAYNNY